MKVNQPELVRALERARKGNEFSTIDADAGFLSALVSRLTMSEVDALFYVQAPQGGDPLGTSPLNILRDRFAAEVAKGSTDARYSEVVREVNRVLERITYTEFEYVFNYALPVCRGIEKTAMPIPPRRTRPGQNLFAYVEPKDLPRSGSTCASPWARDPEEVLGFLYEHHKGAETMLRNIVEDVHFIGAHGKSADRGPVATIMLAGPPGTGKTSMGSLLANAYGVGEPIIIPCGAYRDAEMFSAALFGAPPSYKGTEDGGLLVNKLKQDDVRVVVFDEFDRGPSEIESILMHLTGEGMVPDFGSGKELSVRNCLVILTTNLAMDRMQVLSEKGIDVHPKDICREARKAMVDHLAPELLNRVTWVVPLGVSVAAIESLVMRCCGEDAAELEKSPSLREHFVKAAAAVMHEGARSVEREVRFLRREVRRIATENAGLDDLPEHESRGDGDLDGIITDVFNGTYVPDK